MIAVIEYLVFKSSLIASYTLIVFLVGRKISEVRETCLRLLLAGKSNLEKKWQVLVKLNMCSPCDPKFHSEIFTQEDENLWHSQTRIGMSMAALFMITQNSPVSGRRGVKK